MTRGRPSIVRLYGALLVVFPRGFRRRYAEEMVDFFTDAWESASGVERARLLVRTVVALIGHGLLERWRGIRMHGRSADEGWSAGVLATRPGKAMMGGLSRDVRFALRGIRRRPGFSSLAVLTVGLGIGAASAVFSVVDAVAFRPLPYPEPDRLVAMWTTFEGQGDFGMSLAEHYDYAQESEALESLGSFTLTTSTLTGLGEARPVAVAMTWGDLFGTIGAHAALGRLPGGVDAASGAAPVAVVSYAFWASSLAGDPAAVGRTIDLDGTSVELIGVLAPGVRLPNARPDVWRPIAVDRADIVDRSGHGLEGIGRLAPGATLASLRAEIDEVHARWARVWAGFHSPGHTAGHSFATASVHERWFGGLRAPAGLLLAAVLLVLALASANVASLLLARGEGRVADLSLRRALGAPRSALVRQLLVESLVLSAIGGALGLLLAALGADALMRLEPGNLPRADTVGIDARVTTFATTAAVFSGLLFGLVPALRAGAAPDRSGRRALGPDRSLSRSLGALVVVQVALAVVLLSGAGLLVRTLGAIAESDPGLSTEGRLTFQLSLPQPRYPGTDEIDLFWSRVLAEVHAIPGVESAALVRLLPLRDPLRREGIEIEGRDPGTDGTAPVAYGLVSPGYFATVGVPVVEGRELASTDERGGTWVGVVNEAAARAYWQGRSPLGARVRPLFMPRASGAVTIVGVVGDVRAEGVRSVVTPELYLSYAQTPGNVGYARQGTVVARSNVDPASLAGAVQDLVRRIDPEVPVTDLATYDEVASEARARERFLATVMGVFAALALLIAGMGTYGVVAYAVARRTREFGVRVALGAGRAQLVHSVLRRGAALAAAGAALGLLGVIGAGPWLEGLLYGVAPLDTVSLTAAPLLMGVLVLTATLAPALRAGRVDPLEALRDET